MFCSDFSWLSRFPSITLETGFQNLLVDQSQSAEQSKLMYWERVRDVLSEPSAVSQGLLE